MIFGPQRTLCIAGAGLLISACASAGPPLSPQGKGESGNTKVEKLIAGGHCDDAWHLALRMGDLDLVRSVDAACRIDPSSGNLTGRTP